MPKNKSKKKVKISRIKIIFSFILILIILSGSIAIYSIVREQTRTVTIILSTGYSYEADVTTFFARIKSLNAPELEGYNFEGWYLDDSYSKAYDPMKKFVFGSTTIYAKMTQIVYCINFISGGSEINFISFNYGTIPYEPAPPSRADYMFAGWYKDEQLSDKYSFNELINSDFTLYGDWVLISDALNYSISNNKANITGYKSGISQYLYIPEFIEGMEVSGIANSAFSGCTKLKEVYIPNYNIIIGTNLFINCNSINKMTIPLLTDFSRVNTMLCAYFNYSTSLSVPESLKTVHVLSGTTEIRDIAFADCIYINKVVLPEGITVIGNGAFYGCQQLTEVVIPSTVINLGLSAFNNCISLKKVIIPYGVTSIRSATFYNCIKLEEVLFLGNITRIESSAFFQCENLTNINFPNSLDTLGQHAFGKCEKLEGINISNTALTAIPEGSFYFCIGLKSISFPSTLVSIGGEAFNNCTSLTSIIIPNSVTTIGSYAFNKCNKLNNVILPENLTVLDSFVFAECSSLSAITLNEGLILIKNQAFYRCLALNSITIPSTVTTINDNPFNLCQNLDTIYVKATTPPSLSSNSLLLANQYLNIYVPSSSVDAYKSATYWSSASARISALQ